MVELLILAALAAAPASARAADDAGMVVPEKVCAELVDAAREADAARRRLAEEHKAIASERARLSAQAKEVSSARAELTKETARLEALIKEAEGAATGGRTARLPPVPPQEAERLAKTLAAMTPEAAAQVLRQLDRPLAIHALRAMRPAASGPILERLDPALAAELLQASPVRRGRAARR